MRKSKFREYFLPFCNINFSNDVNTFYRLGDGSIFVWIFCDTNQSDLIYWNKT